MKHRKMRVQGKKKLLSLVLAAVMVVSQFETLAYAVESTGDPVYTIADTGDSGESNGSAGGSEESDPGNDGEPDSGLNDNSEQSSGSQSDDGELNTSSESDGKGEPGTDSEQNGENESNTSSEPGNEGESDTSSEPGNEGESDTGSEPGNEGESDTGSEPGNEGDSDTSSEPSDEGEPDSGADEGGQTTPGEDSEDNTQIGDGQFEVKIGANGWIGIEEGSSLEVVDGNDIIATWSIAEGGKFSKVVITGDEEITVTEPGPFSFSGEECSLSESDGVYTLQLNNADCNITIAVYGEAEVPVEPVEVHISGNEWIEIDEETGLVIEDGVVTATWSIKTDGKLDSVIITNEDGTTTVTTLGDFTFLEQPCSLEQVGSVYTLKLNGIQKDTTIQVVGASALPETVTVKLNTREELLVVDEFHEQYQGPGGSDFNISLQFAENVVLNSFTIKVGDASNTIGLTPGDFVVGDQTYNLELTQGPTGRPVYVIHLNHLIADAEITPNIQQTVSTSVNDPSRVLLQTNSTIVTSDNGNATISWSVADKNKLESITLASGEETLSLGDDNRTFTIHGASGTLSKSGSQYTITLTGITFPISVTIAAVDDVVFGGFELSKDKSLLPFKVESGSSTNSMGLTVSYQTREDGSVVIYHNADSLRYHGRYVRAIYQSHYNGQVIPSLTSPITVTVTVRCTAGCGKTESSSVTIPYRQVNVRFQDEKGNPLPAPAGFTTECYSMDNRTYEFSPPAISWYEYMEGSAVFENTAASSTLLEEGNKVYFALDSGERGTIVLTYRARGRVNFEYEDELGNPIYFEDATTSVDGYRDDQKTVSVPSHEWYDFVSAELTTQGSTPSGEITSQDSQNINVKLEQGAASTVTLKYRAKALVNVKYVDEQGNPIDDLIPPEQKLTQVSGYRGDTEVVPTPDVPNYQYITMRIQTEGQTPSGTINAGSKTLTLGFEDASTLYVVYQPKASVNVRYVDDLGNPIDVTGVAGAQEKISGLRGETYDVNTPDIENYTYERMYLTTPGDNIYSGILDPDAKEVTLNREYASTITVVYRAKASFKVEYVDDQGNNIDNLMPQGTPFEYTGHRDDTITIPTPEIQDYDYRSMSISHPDTGSGPNESAALDPQTHIATLKAGYNSVVQVVYWAKGSVSIRYQDELGNEIPFEDAVKSTSGYRSDVNTISLPQHPYYDLESVTINEPAIPSGTVNEYDKDSMKVGILIGDDSEITVTYKAKADVAIKYVDELGNPIDDLMPEGTPDMISGYRGETFDVPTPDMADYVYESMSISTPEGETVSGTLDPETKKLTMGFENASTVTVVYHAKASVNIRYVDDLGNPIDSIMPEGSATIISGLRGEHYTVQIPTLEDYDFEQMFLTTPEGGLESGFLNDVTYDLELNAKYASTVTLVYHAKASFRVEYIDDLGQNINDVVIAESDRELLPTEPPFVYTGHRGDEITIQTPELEDYQFNSMIVQSGVSVSLNPETHLATMNAGYDGVIYVKYDYRATVYLKYEDMNGKDISAEFDPANPTLLEGFRNRTTEIPHPDTGSYIFDHFEIETLPGEEPSGYLGSDNTDPTLTFGVREASTVTVVYRWIDLGIELKGIYYEGEPIEDDDELHLAESADFVWTVTNHGTAPCYPEIEFTVPDGLLLVNRTPNSTKTDNRIKLNTLLQPGESIEVTTEIQVDTVETYERYTIKAVIPESQQDVNGNSYPDIDLTNNQAEGELEVLNPPIIMTKVNSEDHKEKLEKCYIEIYDRHDEMVWEGWSDKDGEFYVTGLYPGEYEVYERYAPEGFAREKKFWTLTVKDDMTARGKQITDEPVRIAIKKISAFTGEPLEGAVFGLYDEDGKLVETQTSGEDGMLYFERLDWGKYTIEELEAPAGFMASGKVIRLNITDKYMNEDEPYIVRNAGTVNTGIGPVPIFLGPACGIGALGGIALLVILKGKKKDDEDAQ